MKINDMQLLKAFESVSADNRVTRPEVEQLLRSAYDSARVTSTEKADLQRILAEKGDTFTAPAKKAMTDFLAALRPDGTHPTASIDFGNTATPLKLNDLGLRNAWATAAKDNRMTRPEVENLIKSAYDSGRVTETEKADLKRMLAQKGDMFTAAGRTALENFIGRIRADGTHPDMPTTGSN